MANVIEHSSFADIDNWIERAKQGGPFSKEVLHTLCCEAISVFKLEENVLRLSIPCTICGDIHGQFTELLELFCIYGWVPDTNYLFLGDYIDRGYYSLETIVLLILLKIRYPNRVYLLRGNHESRFLSKSFGFYDQVMRVFNDECVWEEFMSVFDCLPICAIVCNSIFAVHAGIGPDLHSVDDVASISRFQEIPLPPSYHSGLFCDLLWSDPYVGNGYKPSARGISSFYGEDVSLRFLLSNSLKCIIRGHELVMSGYSQMHKNKVITVFSAPNYCYYVGNSAAVAEVDEYGHLSFSCFRAPLISCCHDRAHDL